MVVFIFMSVMLVVWSLIQFKNRICIYIWKSEMMSCCLHGCHIEIEFCICLQDSEICNVKIEFCICIWDSEPMEAWSVWLAVGAGWVLLAAVSWVFSSWHQWWNYLLTEVSLVTHVYYKPSWSALEQVVLMPRCPTGQQGIRTTCSRSGACVVWWRLPGHMGEPCVLQP